MPTSDGADVDADWPWTAGELRRAIGLSGSALVREIELSPVLAAQHCLDAIGDEVIERAVRDATSHARRELLDALRLPRGTTPRGSLVRSKLEALPEEEQRTHALLMLSRRPAEILREALEARWTEEVPDEPSEDLRAALCDAIDEVAAQEGEGFTRLAALGLSLELDLAGWPFAVALSASSVAHPSFEDDLGSTNFEVLRDAVEVAAEASRRSIDELPDLLALIEQHGLPTDHATLRDDLVVLLRGLQPMVDICEALRPLRESLGFPPLPDRLTYAALEADIEQLQAAATRSRPSDAPKLTADGSVGEALDALYGLSESDESAALALLAFDELLELLDAGDDDESIADMTEQLSRALEEVSAHLLPATPPSILASALRGRIRRGAEVSLEATGREGVAGATVGGRTGTASDGDHLPAEVKTGEEVPHDADVEEDRGNRPRPWVLPGLDQARSDRSPGDAPKASRPVAKEEAVAADQATPSVPAKGAPGGSTPSDEVVDGSAGAVDADPEPATSADGGPDVGAASRAGEAGDPTLRDSAEAEHSVGDIDDGSASDGTDTEGSLGAHGTQAGSSLEVGAALSGRLALASHAARLDGSPERADAYEALALVHAMRSGTGAAASAAAAIFRDLDRDALSDRAVAHLALAATLRAAVHAPTPELLVALESVRSVWSHDAPIDRLLDVVLQGARTGVNVAADSTALRDAASREGAVAAASAAARRELDTPHQNKLVAATVVWNTWTRSDGILGRLLTAADADDRSQVESVAQEISRLRDRAVLRSEVADADPRATKRNQITAGALDRLLDWATHALDVAAAWVEAVRAVSAVESTTKWSGLLTRLRQVAQEQELASSLAIDDPDLIVRASARAAERSLAQTLSIFVNGPDDSAGPEPGVGEVMNDHLLLGPTPHLRSDGSTADPPSAQDLELAIQADPEDIEAWTQAFEARTSAHDHVATARIASIVARFDPSAADALGAKRAIALEGARHDVLSEHRRVAGLLASARSHGQLDDADWSKLSGQLEALDPSERADLWWVRQEVAEVEIALEAIRSAAIAAMSERMEVEAADGAVSEEDVARIKERIAAADLATAEEYLALAMDGRSLPRPPVSNGVFRSWWPEMAEEIASFGVDGRMVKAARSGGRVGKLSFSNLDESARQQAAAGLESWLRLSERSSGQLIDDARPLLTLLGIEATRVVGLPGERTTPDRLWRNIVGFRRTGKALVPDFGSQASGAAEGDTLLLLICRGQPRGDTVASWIGDESSARPVMVWYLGALDPADRVALADELRRGRHRRSVVIIDDSVVAFLAAAGGNDYETSMRVTLPFAAVNPYQSVGGLTPPEMFYGRDGERRSLADPMGSGLVYGGRQLGKSSLLRATGREFDDGANRRSLYLDLKAEGIGPTRPPDNVWDLLWRSLVPLGVTSGEAPAMIRERLQDAVLRWLDGAPGRALLILFDECDRFLEADADSHFETVDALDHLMTATGRRVKFVFAGLHRVQRFKSVQNQPLTHLGAPIAVGPLRPREAMSLIVEPTGALGYTFEHDELPSRIMAFCNGNPSLIVLFMQALIDRMLDQPLRMVGPERPPVVIKDVDVEATYRTESLAELIRERFELTLDLDPAYKVIAYSVAHEARERGEGAEMSVRELRDIATGWWPKGFAEVSSDGFRALCDELVDLGVLAFRHGNYGLRSPNILRFLGPAEQIAEVLIEAENLRPEASFDAATARPRLSPEDPDRRSPLTASQIAELLAPRSQVRLVTGAEANGLPRVLDMIERSAGSAVAVSRADPATTRLAGFKSTSGQHRVVLLDLTSVGPDRATRLVREALEVRRPRGVTSSFIFVAGPNHHSLWRTCLSGGEPWDRVGITSVGPVDGRAWRNWIHEGDLPLADDNDSGEILERSGGVLDLLEGATRALRSGGKRAALEALDEVTSSPGAAEQLLASVGLTTELRGVFRAICEYALDGGDPELLAEAAEIAGGTRDDVEVLRILGLLYVDGEERLKPCRAVFEALDAAQPMTRAH